MTAWHPVGIGCGACSYCRAGHHAPCDRANPNGPGAGTRFFGGPESTVRLRDDMTDDDAVLLADILPMSWFGARLAEVSSGDTVAVFGGGGGDRRPVETIKHLTGGTGPSQASRWAVSNCNHRRYLHRLIDLVSSGKLGLASHLTQQEPLTDVLSTYEHFDERSEGWTKVGIIPGQA